MTTELVKEIGCTHYNTLLFQSGPSPLKEIGCTHYNTLLFQSGLSPLLSTTRL